MLFILGFNYYILNIQISLGDLLRRLTFTQNFFSLDDNYYKKFPEGWSLAVEEWFYTIIPLLIFLSLLISKKIIKYHSVSIFRAIYICAFLILISITSYRLYLELHLQEKINIHLVIMRLDAILYGVIGATIAYLHTNFWKKIHFYSLSFSLILFTINKVYFSEIKSISLILDSIFVLGLLPLLSNLRIEKHNLITKFITWISLISYSMYLLNLFIIDNLVNPFTELYSNKNSIKFTIFFTLCFICSSLLYRYFETPVMKLRDRVAKK